ncbi:hypothetical protein B0H16DRAFT_1806690 [Mycena metata]|uniref:Uncharacterized protein n=1 Tax=Mycena metata TaxID=1033252 RepID=A0AAD7H8Z3_9AGAR|nr:hypothetical protein B0H16DRAFT_1806690 [Mycena metata]
MYQTKSRKGNPEKCETIPFVEELSKDVKGDDRYVLHAGYSKETGLSVRVILPENVRIELSPNVRSGPLSLSIDTKPSLSIEFSAILWVIPDGQDPLELTFSLRANELDASGFAQMKGWWKNPLDLSPRLKIGPILALQVAINYSQFLSTGMPSEIGFAGGLLVDEKDNYLLAFNLGTNPKQTLLSLQVRRLAAEEVITLVNAVADFELKSPKEEIIRFEDVDIYASPLGCLLGTKIYPPGFVVKGKAFILGKKVEIDCSLGSNGMKLKGEVDGFSLGPLGVHGGKRVDGTRGENPLIDLEITKERQHFEVSGSIELWSLEASVFVLIEIMPEPQLEFNFELSWSELVRFQVKGELIKDPANAKRGVLGSLDNADFKLYALMEQRILASVAESMRTWFQKAQVSVDADIQAAKRKVDEAKAELDRRIEEAKQEVEETRKRFNEKMEAAQAGLRETEMQCANESAVNERWILEEEKRAEAEIRAANSKLDAVQKEFEDDMEQKKRNLSRTRGEGEEAINGKIRDLQDTRVSFQRDFGNAIEALERAEARVREESWRVREAEDRVNQARSEYNNAAWYEKTFKGFQVEVLEAECFVKKCALGAAELILRGAKGVVEGVAYNAARVAVDIAEGALVTAQNMLAGAIAEAQSLLDGVVALHAGAIGLAKDALTAAQAVALGIKKAAYVVRDQLIALHQNFLEAARGVVKAVAEGIDFIAFQSALKKLDKVQKDTTLVAMAKAGLDAANAVAQTALAAGAWLASQLASTLNIELIELTASLRAITDGGEFTIHVKGVILGEPLDWRGTWNPRNTLAFIFELCAKLWNDFLADAGRLMIAMK